MSIHIAALLDKAKDIHSLPSDYKLALVMGISHVSLLSYRSGKTLPDARVISLLCDLTGDDPAILAAEIEAERAKSPQARALWLEISERLAMTARHGVAAGVLSAVALGAALPSPSAHAAESGVSGSSLYIMLNRRARKCSRNRSLFRRCRRRRSTPIGSFFEQKQEGRAHVSRPQSHSRSVRHARGHGQPLALCRRQSPRRS